MTKDKTGGLKLRTGWSLKAAGKGLWSKGKSRGHSVRKSNCRGPPLEGGHIGEQWGCEDGKVKRSGPGRRGSMPTNQEETDSISMKQKGGCSERGGGKEIGLESKGP